MPDELYPLSSGWALWRWMAVRGAGFPAATVLELAAPDVGAAVDRMRACEADVATACDRAIAIVERELESRTDRAQRAERRALATVLRRLRARAVPETPIAFAPDVTALVEAVRVAVTAHAAAREAATTVLAAERDRLGEHVRACARDPRLREALAWQNRNALHTAIEPLLRHDGGTSSKARQHEQLVASYLQRYCVKNDTIGFFGPVGWARLAHEPGRGLVARPGAQLLASRTVYFEHWGIDLLATTIANDPTLRPHIPPRRHPFVRLDNTVLHHPIDRTTELPYEYACVLAACDGERSAREIAEALVADPDVEVSDPSEVYDMLDELVAKRAVVWSLAVPTHVEHPERVLASELERIGEPASRGLAIVGEITAARDAIARAAGDPDAVDRALAHLEQVFTKHTDAAALRRPGATYAGRSLVYEDCRRDIAIELDPATFDRLRAPLALLLQIARWFTFTLAGEFRTAFVALHRDLAAETGAPAIDFLRFWDRASDQFAGSRDDPPAIIARVVGELQRRWAQLLELDDATRTARVIDRPSAALNARANDLFAAPHPGWPSARHHSPDLMIAARDADSIARGDLVFVLGEMHVGIANFAPWIQRQHPSPEDIVAQLDRERTVPVVEPVVSKERAGRADMFSLLAKDYALEIASAGSLRPPEQVLEVAELVVEPAGDSLRLATRDGTRSFAFEQWLDWFLSNDSAPHFKLDGSGAPHTPRVLIDGVVVTRETWRFDGEQLAFARVDDVLDRIAAVRGWAREHDLPRFVFYKVPQETKPCFLDLESPHYIEQLARQVRQASRLVVSEMLPGIDEAWLPDANGARYTCELRIVALDPVEWPSEG